MSEVGTDHLERLAGLLEERLGLRFDWEHHGSLRSALRERLGPAPSPGELDAYLDRLGREPAELARLLPLVTVGKTSFFRDERQFAALRLLLPELLERSRAEGRRLAIWSAGCSTGEEAYSLGVELLQAGARLEEVELVATDVNEDALAVARAGRYVADGELPSERLAMEHLRREGDELFVSDELRSLVRFEVHNLHAPLPPHPEAGRWDLVFCRNVLIYFTGEALRGVIDRIHRALRPGGWLFLGYSESLFRIYDGFDLRPMGGSYLYQRPATARVSKSSSAMLLAPQLPKGDKILEPPSKGAASAPPPPPKGREGLGEQEGRILRQAIDRFREGAFASAKAILEVGVRTHTRSVGMRLTLAHIHAVIREVQEANARYEEAIALDDLLAEPYLFYGMHLIGQEETERAARMLKRATFLDPTVALAHFFLGRCQEKLLDLDAARRAYRNAIWAAAQERAPYRFLSYYPDLPEDEGAVARAAELALAGL